MIQNIKKNNNTIHKQSMESWLFSLSWGASNDIIYPHNHFSCLTC